jgi:alkanesulfonate monooxygenase SsuD/methylene tetrahydromethanopterin reductase-like flavin-dependent oxidoreductase (luciferase family)
LVELGVAAEAHGMDSAAVSVHFQLWRVCGHAPFALSWMAAVGERTQRIVLGTSVHLGAPGLQKTIPSSIGLSSRVGSPSNVLV